MYNSWIGNKKIVLRKIISRLGASAIQKIHKKRHNHSRNRKLYKFLSIYLGGKIKSQTPSDSLPPKC